MEIVDWQQVDAEMEAERRYCLLCGNLSVRSEGVFWIGSGFAHDYCQQFNTYA